MAHGPPARRRTSNHNGQISTQDEVDEDVIVPPDGGWGWMVAIASFLIHLITDGITYSFGIFFNELLSDFKESNALTASIASILVGMTLCSGPISSSFVNRYGCRAVTIAGAILSFFCFLISVFATSIYYLIVTIGIGCGIGFGLIYLPAIVSVTMYFEKYRSLATGIAVCGSGLGTFVFAPFIEYLVGEYGWRGAMLILSALILNCIIFGIMFRPLEPQKKNKTNNRRHLSGTEHSNDCTELEPLKSNQQSATFSQGNTLQVPNNDNDYQLSRSHSISHDFNSRTKYSLTNGSKNHISQTKDQKNDIIRATVSQPHINNIGTPRKNFKETKLFSGSGTMYRPDILYQGSLLNISEYRSRTDLSKMAKETNRYGSLGNTNQGDQDVEKLCGCVPCSKETSDTFSEMMNFSLLRDTIFIVFVLSNFCTSIGFNIPYLYIAAQVKALQMNEEYGSYLLSVIGIANTVGRIVLGYISDKPWVNRLLVYNLCLTACGISTILSIFCYDFITFAIYSSVFGFTIGAYVGLTSVILVDLLGLDKLTNAFGLLLLFQGVASLLGPPFAGWLYDITKYYEYGFVMGGITVTISGLILFIIPPMQKYRAKQQQQDSQFSATSPNQVTAEQRISKT